MRKDQNTSIIIENLYKTYKTGIISVNAVKNVSFKFEEGKFYAIVGRSGSGKSTLLHMIGGLDNPTSGNVIFNGKNIAKMNENFKAKFRAKNIGFVFQAFHLESSYSCMDNVILPLIANSVPRRFRKKKAKDVLKKVGLLERIKHKPCELSGGEKQRVAIARALINNPSVVLADEPTGNLDSDNGKIIMNILKEISNEGKIVILVTHNKEDALYADEVLKIQDGVIEMRSDKNVK